MNAQTTNALAGPSNISDSHNTALPLFLPPVPPPEHVPPPSHLRSTQDLLSRLQLLPAYDRHVRPSATPVGTAADSAASPQAAVNGVDTVDKGKGKEKDVGDGSLAGAPTPGGPGQDGDEDGKGDKKKRNNYRHLIKGVPGKHSMKKDDYLMMMMNIPPKERVAIRPFDMVSQEEAFTVAMDGLKGWNIGALVGESAQAKEDRKKRKELKKLQKQGDGVSSAPTPATALPTGPSTPLAAPLSTAGAPSQPATALKSAIPRPGSRPPTQSQAGTRPSTPARASTPSAAAPAQAARATPAVPSPRPPVTHALPARPVTTPVPAQPPNGAQRGQKRALEDGEQMSNGAPPNGAATTPSTIPLPFARAGVPGARPRPVKKARMDSHGIGRDMPVQQPTPQGV